MDIRSEFKDFIEEKGYSLTYISKATSLSKTVLSLWMNGCYKGKNERIKFFFLAIKSSRFFFSISAS